jgi:hypothetical protein
MKKVSRRSVLASLSLAGTAAVVAGTAAPARAAQPHMEAALDLLKDAQKELDKATPDKGGYRAKAIRNVRDAIYQVEKGIDWARRH